MNYFISCFLLCFVSLVFGDNHQEKAGLKKKKGNVLLKVSISQQKVYLVKNDMVKKIYPVSTGYKGIGNKPYQTPLGTYKICEKIGDGASLGTIFKWRGNTHKIAAITTHVSDKLFDEEDLITTRILWVDIKNRYIYFHGTPKEGLIGRPVSHGCIRMKNKDIVDLYDRVEKGTQVKILP